MVYAVGIDVGSACTTAAIVRLDGASSRNVCRTGVAAAEPTVVFVDEDGELLIGRDAEQRGVNCPQRVIRDFTSRIGDGVPVAVDSWSERPEAIFAAVVRSIIDGIVQREGGRPAAIAVSHPADWGPYKRALVADALNDAELPDVFLVTEPRAAATHAAELADVELGKVVLYDLGAASFDATVLTRAGSTFEPIGSPKSLDWLGGGDFDQSVFSLVTRNAGLKKLNSADRESVGALGRLRRNCIDAKEALSMDTETTIPVVLPHLRTRVRLVRSEFEELIRDAVEDTIDATNQTIASAGLDVDDIDAFVLVGGSSRIPLVTQLISAEFSRPVIIDVNPELSTALGAARMALAQSQPQQLRVGVEILDVNAQPEPISRQLAHAWHSAPQEISEPEFAQGMSDSAAPAVPMVPTDRAGRHRQPGRRNWLRSVGLFASCSALVFAGSSLAPSRPAGNPPAESVQAVQADGGAVEADSSDGRAATAPAGGASGAPGQAGGTLAPTVEHLVAEVTNLANAFVGDDTADTSWGVASSTPSTSSSASATPGVTKSAAPPATGSSASSSQPAGSAPPAGAPLPSAPSNEVTGQPADPPPAQQPPVESSPEEPPPSVTPTEPTTEDPGPSDVPPVETEPTDVPSVGSTP